MVFSSILFLFLFLPLFLSLYHVMPFKLKNLFLLVASLLFYYWGETWFTAVMILSIIIDYSCGLVIAGAFTHNRGKELKPLEPDKPRTRTQKLALVISICGNLFILGFFKYFNFGLENYNALMAKLGLDAAVWESSLRIALPLGISFFTFQSMSYTIDVYRGVVPATRNFLNFAAFVSMFPQLVAGPIVRYKTVEEELRVRSVTRHGFSQGVRRFILGLGKKVLIANTVALVADQVFAIPGGELTFAVSWLGVFCYTLQIYFDFSAYSDMAIGLGLMLGFNFPENFNYPYISRSITEFWRRWHISLSTWFRDYLYIPLGGNKASPLKTYRNLFVVFILCGLWHGASWNFLVWGLFHGFFLVFERLVRGRFQWKLPRPVSSVYVMLVTMVSWVLFRSETLGYAVVMLKAMVGLGAGDGQVYYAEMYLDNQLIAILILGTVGAAAALPGLLNWRHEMLTRSDKPWARALDSAISIGALPALALIFYLSAVELSSSTHNPFIYFRF